MGERLLAAAALHNRSHMAEDYLLISTLALDLEIFACHFFTSNRFMI
jgi:hypothetical protein